MGIMLRMRALPARFIAPCLPTKTDKLPSGGLWLHEIKHDGFRIIARKGESLQPARQRLHPPQLIVETLARLRWRTRAAERERDDEQQTQRRALLHHR